SAPDSVQPPAMARQDCLVASGHLRVHLQTGQRLGRRCWSDGLLNGCQPRLGPSKLIAKVNEHVLYFAVLGPFHPERRQPRRGRRKQAKSEEDDDSSNDLALICDCLEWAVTNARAG